jgi:hypothetical protein
MFYNCCGLKSKNLTCYSTSRTRKILEKYEEIIARLEGKMGEVKEKPPYYMMAGIVPVIGLLFGLSSGLAIVMGI